MLLREIRRQADPSRPLVVIFQSTSHPGHDMIPNSGRPFATFLRRKAGAAVVIEDYESWCGFGGSGPDYTMYVLASGSKGWRKGRRLTTKQIRSLKLDKE